MSGTAETSIASLAPYGTMMRGYKIRLDVSAGQAAQLDRWRNGVRRLWNLLLSMEMAAYSGDISTHAELRWREIWIRSIEENYQRDMLVYQGGRGGKRAKESGVGREAERQALKERLDGLKKGSAEFKEVLAQLKKIAPQPVPLAADTKEKILRGKNGDDEPKLFIWERELLAITARLKQVEQTAWIGELPSHAAQTVAKDLVKALNAMLKAKREGRHTGFPRFKKSYYATGSVYFANTQIKLDTARATVTLSNGIGAVKYFGRSERTRDVLPGTDGKAPYLYRAGRNQPYYCGDGRVTHKKGRSTGAPRRAFAKRVQGGKLLGGRVYREGETWWLSLQFEIPKPAPLPLTGKIAGVKIAAAVPLTTFDGRNWRQTEALPPNKDEIAKHRALAKAKSRKEAAQKRREQKFIAKQERLGKPIRKKRFRLRPSKALLDVKAALAELPAIESRRMADFIHQRTTKLVRDFDVLAMQKMDVKRLMRTPQQTRRKRRREEQPKDKAARRSTRNMRKMMARASMATWRMQVQYKAPDYGKIYEETEVDFKEVQIAHCHGELHPEMRDGRLYLRCETCGKLWERRKNAAVHEFRRASKATEKKLCSPDV